MKNLLGLFCLSLALFAPDNIFSQTKKDSALRPTISHLAPAPHYDLTLRLAPENKRLEVTGTMRLPPFSNSRDKIELLLWSRMTDAKFELLEPSDVATAGVEVTNDEADGDRKWTIKTNAAIPINSSVLIRLSYRFDGQPAPQFNISPEGSFAGGAGELWYPQTSFNEQAIGTLRFRVPAGETVISNGALQSSMEQQAKGEFVFQVNAPSKFGFASGRYTVLHRAGQVPIALYSLQSRANSQMVLDKSAKALDSLTTLFGAFPYERFSLVEVDFRSSVAGTSEYGFILADRSVFDKEFNLAYWAHEIGHQWWGVNLKSASGTTGRMMFSEGMAQFGALLAVERIEGAKAAEKFRRDGLYNVNQSAAGYFRLAAAGTEFPLTTYTPHGQEEILRMHRLANSKGFIVMDMLSRQIGRERFAAILRRFVERKAGQTTSWQELQRAIEADAGRDIRWFFEQWFERTGAPEYQITWKQTGKRVRGFVTQPSPAYRATLEIELKGSKRTLTKTIEVRGERTPFDWSAPFVVDDVVLDSHYKVLRWTPEFRALPSGSSDAKKSSY